MHDYTEKYAVLIILPIALLIGLNLLLFYLSYKDEQVYRLNLHNEALKMAIDVTKHQYTLESNLHTQFRKEKHNYRNLLIGIQSLLEKNNYSNAISLISEHIGLLGSHQSFNTGNHTIDTVINYKAEAAQRKGISLNVKSVIDTEFDIPADDMCILLGVGLDNAIEYLTAHNELNQCINIHLVTNQNLLIIDITNPVAEKININNNHIPSTKQSDEHGLGLESARFILNKYNGQLALRCTDDTFHFGATMLL